MSKEVLIDDYRFNGAMKPPAVASVLQGPWCSKITGSGPPTVAAASGGLMQLALEATSEVQNACFYMGDVLPYGIDELIQVDIWAKVTASLNAAVSASYGLASARNDALASIAQRVLFKCVGSNALVLDAVDGTNSLTAQATGVTLGTTLVKHTLEFKSGVSTGLPGQAKGGKYNILASVEDANGNLRRVAQSAVLNMGAYTGNLQLFAQIQKTSATAVGTLSIQRMRVKYRRAA
jgi:hypothetical protein